MAKVGIEEIYNVLKLSDSILTAGQPTADQFTAIRDSGYQVVINLALPDSPRALPDEPTIVNAKGMEYIHIPVVWENPTLEDVEQFFKAMQSNTDKPVFVHCAANMRVSAFMYLYRRICEGVEEAIAMRDLHQIWTPNDRWQAFIEQVMQHYQLPK